MYFEPAICDHQVQPWMHQTVMRDEALRPLLKWVGGKRQLLPALRRFYARDFATYVEPFFGSGAVFFDLCELGLLRDRSVVLIDSNPDLIGCYEAVRDDPDAVSDVLEDLSAAHERGGRDHYFAVRDGQFNPQREANRAPGGRIAYTPSLAAMLIYLNRTGFNGLFRVNARGAFNVPPGRYQRPKIADRARVRRVAEALGGDGVSLRWGSFTTAEGLVTAGDFLYIDPPYAPVSDTSNFTSYTSARFGDTEQARLQQMAIALSHRGCRLLISNSTAPVITDLYATNAQARGAGLRALRVPARRAINSNAARRGPVEEYLITNITEQSAAERR